LIEDGSVQAFGLRGSFTVTRGFLAWVALLMVAACGADGNPPGTQGAVPEQYDDDTVLLRNDSAGQSSYFCPSWCADDPSQWAFVEADATGVALDRPWNPFYQSCPDAIANAIDRFLEARRAAEDACGAVGGHVGWTDWRYSPEFNACRSHYVRGGDSTHSIQVIGKCWCN
jgi:hypothetical protein